VGNRSGIEKPAREPVPRVDADNTQPQERR
jgi:hypothetical protein